MLNYLLVSGGSTANHCHLLTLWKSCFCPEVQSAARVLPCGGLISLAHHHCCQLPRWTPGPVPLYQMSLGHQQSLPNLVIDC